MATIASLVVSLKANSAQFVEKLKNSRAATQRWARSVRKQVNETGKAFALMAAAAGVALAALVKNQAVIIDQSAKFADVIGLTTEQLTGYQVAASITGVELGQLNTGLTRFQKNIADAEAGMATSQREFARLNINFKDLRNLSTDEQLKLVADRFNELGSTIDKSSVLLNLFGRSGIAIGKLLEEGADGITRFQNEAKELNLSLSRVDAAKVEAMNDAVERVNFATKGLTNTITVALAPVVEAVANRFSEAAKESGGFTKQVESGMKIAAKAVGFFADTWRGLQILIKGMQLTFSAYITLVVGAITKTAEFARSVANIVPGVEITPLDKMNAALETGIDTTKRLKKEFDDLLEQKLPSEGIDALFAQVQQEAQANAESAISGKSGKAGSGTGAGLDGLENEATSAGTALTNFRKKLELINGGTQPALNADNVQYLDISRAKLNAQKALAAGDNAGAIKFAEQGAEIARLLQEAGKASTLQLQGALKPITKIAELAAGGKKEKKEEKPQSIGTFTFVVGDKKFELTGTPEVGGNLANALKAILKQEAAQVAG